MQDVAMQHLEGNEQRVVCPGAFPAGAAGDVHTALLSALSWHLLRISVLLPELATELSQLL